MPPLPSPVRAAIGLAVTVLDEAKHLPDKAIELPMLAVSRALQLSLRAQQRYTALAARGDELLAARHVADAAPAWATFDEPVSAAQDERVARMAGRPADPTAQSATDAVPVETHPESPTDAMPTDAAPTEAHPVTPKAPARRPRPAKTVRAPRTGASSAFDAVGDTAEDEH